MRLLTALIALIALLPSIGYAEIHDVKMLTAFHHGDGNDRRRGGIDDAAPQPTALPDRARAGMLELLGR